MSTDGKGSSTQLLRIQFVWTYLWAILTYGQGPREGLGLVMVTKAGHVCGRHLQR